MRFVAKGAPPLNVSPPGQVPTRFVDAEKDLLRRLDAFVAPEGADDAEQRSTLARTRFDAMHKPLLREKLIAEQHGLCVYCEDRVREPKPASGVQPPPIEHWRALSRSPRTAIHWKNLYQSCDRDECCDKRKGDTPLASETGEALPWPCDFHYEEAIGVSKGGDLYVRHDMRLSEALRAVLAGALGRSVADREQGDRLASLNLNHPTLREARAAAMDGERDRLERLYDRTVSAEEREQRAAELLSQPTRMPFVSARVAWLRRQTRR